MADEPRHYEMNAEPGAVHIEGTPLKLAVSKQMKVTTEGYRRAVERLRQAIAEDDGDGVYFGVTEAALTYARDRSHHQWASVVEQPESRGWKWRRADLPPTSENPQHQGLNGKLPNYEKRLEEKPVIEVFDRLGSLIEELDS